MRRHRLRQVRVSDPQVRARLLDVAMAEQPLDLVQLPALAVLPQRSLVSEVAEDEIDLGQRYWPQRGSVPDCRRLCCRTPR